MKSPVHHDCTLEDRTTPARAGCTPQASSRNRGARQAPRGNPPSGMDGQSRRAPLQPPGSRRPAMRLPEPARPTHRQGPGQRTRRCRGTGPAASNNPDLSLSPPHTTPTPTPPLPRVAAAPPQSSPAARSQAGASTPGRGMARARARPRGAPAGPAEPLRECPLRARR